MTKYVSFKIFDSEDHPNGFEGIKDKQIKKYYTWVHEDYFEGIIKAHLEDDYNCIKHKWIGMGFCPECEEIVKSEVDYQNNCPYRTGESY